MGVLSFGKRVFTSMVNIRVDQWLGYSAIKDSIGQIKSTVQPSFTVEHAEQQEDFDAAIDRLHLTQEDLASREREFTKLFCIYLLAAIALFGYSIYLFVRGNWGGGLMTLGITLYPINLAFKFHFWLFQIKNKKLGCSLKDWWNS